MTDNPESGISVDDDPFPVSELEPRHPAEGKTNGQASLAEAYPSDQNRDVKLKSIDVIDPIRWHDAPIPPRRWLVDGLIPDRNVTMLAGDGGVGKTLLALQLAAACALGRQWLGTPTKPVKALAVLCEDEPDEIHRRLAAILDHYQASFGDLENLAILTRVGVDNSLMNWSNSFEPGEETATYIRILNLATDHGYQLVILDSLHDFFAGNENARPQARQFIQALRTIATEADGAVVITAHPSLSGRNTGTGEAGSTAWNNAVRSRLYLTLPDTAEDEAEDRDSRLLKTMKSNYGPAGGAIPLRWKDGVFVRDDSPGGMVESIARNQTQQVFLEGLCKATKQGRNLSQYANQPNYAPKIIAGMAGTGKHSKAQLKRAMDDLFDAGKIVVGTPFLRANRHPAVGLVIVGELDL